jgi:hypothetical protein
MCGNFLTVLLHSVDSIGRRIMEPFTLGATTQVEMVPKDSPSSRILFIPDLMIKFVVEKLMIPCFMVFIMILCC